MKIYLIIFLSIFMLIACDEDFLDFPPQVEAYVVEGWVTDDPGPQHLILSQTIPFQNPGSARIISNADVKVIDGAGNQYEYSFSPELQMYLSDSSFRGIVGRSYSVQIIVETGDTLQSDPERMRPVHEIETLTYDFYTADDPDSPGDEILIYYPVIFAEDPADEQNFYRWDIYKSDSLFSAPEDLILIEDRFINGAFYKNEFTSFSFFEGDSIGVEVSSLNRSAFEYLNFFRNQSTSIGTSAASSPGPILGNMRNQHNDVEQVLGYFGVVSIKRRGIKIIQ